jgi:hypothetical protein
MVKKKAHFRGNVPSGSDPSGAHEFLETTDLNDTGVETLLRGCRSAYELVGAIAAMEAIETAAEHDVRPPRWALDAAAKDLLGKSKANPLRRLKAEIRDLERWEKVTISELDGCELMEERFKNALPLLKNEGKATTDQALRKSYYKVENQLKNSGDKRLVFWVLERIGQRYSG